MNDKSFGEQLAHYFAPFFSQKDRNRIGLYTKIFGPFEVAKVGTPQLSIVSRAFMGAFDLGLDASLDTMNDKTLTSKEGNHTFLLAGSSWAQFIAGFIGLPAYVKTYSNTNDVLYFRKNDSFIKNIAKNFFGLNSGRKGFFKYAMVLPSAIWNTLRTAGTLGINILKIATEFVPHVIEFLAEKGISSLMSIIAEDRQKGRDGNYLPVVTSPHIITKILMGMLVAPLLPIYYAAKIWRVMGRALTSPDASIKAAFKMGSDLISGITENSIAKTMVGVLFSTFALALTVGLYTILPPLGMHAIATNPHPIFTTLTSLINTAQHFISHTPFIANAATLITNTIGPIVQPVIQTLGLGISANLAVLSMTVGTGIAAITTFFKKIDKTFNRPWKTPVAAAVVREERVREEQDLAAASTGPAPALNVAPNPVATPAIDGPSQEAKDLVTECNKIREMIEFTRWKILELENHLKNLPQDKRQDEKNLTRREIEDHLEFHRAILAHNEKQLKDLKVPDTTLQL